MIGNPQPAIPVRLWLGPALLIAGLSCIALIRLEPPDDRSRLAWWVLTNAGAFQRILPLVGLGIALALLDAKACVATFLLFVAGIAIGSATADVLVQAMERLPTSPERHQFLTAPIQCIAVGVALAAPTGIRRAVAPIAGLLAGMALAVAVWTTVPLFQDPVLTGAGIGFALWIVLGVFLTVRAVRRSWFDIAGRIFGSWLIAIAMLYGGAALVPPHRQAPPPNRFQPRRSSPDSLTGPEPGMSLRTPAMPRRESAPGFDPARQP
jgi:hypothetical protein